MASLEVRALEARDEPDWRRLWTGYLEFYETAVDEVVYTTTFERLLSAGDNEFAGLVALRDDEAIGITHYLFHRHCWRVENVCYLQDLYVDAPVRGTGAGRALIEAVYQRADDAGCPGVYWLTQEFNQAGRRLYDRVATLTPFVKYAR